MPDNLPPVASKSRWRFGARRRPASETLLRLYVSFQLTRAKAVRGIGGVVSGQDLVKRCDDLVANLADASYAQDPRWVDAYAIERELLLTQSGGPLFQSLKMLLDRADATGAPSAKSIRLAYENILGATAAAVPSDAPAQAEVGSEKKDPETAQPHSLDDALMLPLALTALEVVQWSQAKRFEAAPAKRDVVHRIVKVGFVAFVFFVLPYVGFDIAALLDDHIPELDWSWLSLWTALTAGLLGAFFSRLLAIQTHFPDMSVDDIDRVGTWGNIALRFGVGMVGALVVLIFLQSGIVGGKLFPEFGGMKLAGKAGSSALALPTTDLALLVVWCFVAGFSERLVPRILASAEDRLSTAATADGTADATGVKATS